MAFKQNTEKCYCISFQRAAKAVTDYYDAALLPSGVTINQYSLLVHLQKISPCNITDLAQNMKLERTTLVRNIQPLFAAGLIRDLSGKGKRDRQLALTKAGFKRLEAAQPLWEKAQSGIKDYIGGKRFQNLMDTITNLSVFSRMREDNQS